MTAERSTTRRIAGLLGSSALGAVVAQIWQAAGSFAIQILAAHLLGAAGLGTMSLCLGVIVLTAAVASGVVGDSFTILDRASVPIRGGLQVWTIVLAVGAPLLTGVGLAAFGLLTPSVAMVFAVASALFLVEELLRRVLMATLRFWRLVIVDTTSLAITLGTLAASSGSGVTIRSFLVAVAAGQLGGCVVAVGLVPRNERWLAPMNSANLRAAWRLGSWRGAQVAINPAALTGLRVIVTSTVGLAALGTIEAARIFVAPATLVVQGLGSYLLASYARDRSQPLGALMHRATRASTALALGALAIGSLAAVAVPYAGHLVSGSRFVIPGSAVLAWAGYAAAVATVQPFASLAAARGAHRAVFTVRLGDTVLGLSLLWCVMQVLHWPAEVAPLALAIGLLAGGMLIRQVILPRVARGGASKGCSAGASSDDGIVHTEQATRQRVRGISSAVA